jgi:hypothetical protein
LGGIAICPATWNQTSEESQGRRRVDGHRSKSAERISTVNGAVIDVPWVEEDLLGYEILREAIEAVAGMSSDGEPVSACGTKEYRKHRGRVVDYSIVFNGLHPP